MQVQYKNFDFINNEIRPFITHLHQLSGSGPTHLSVLRFFPHKKQALFVLAFCWRRRRDLIRFAVPCSCFRLSALPSLTAAPPRLPFFVHRTRSDSVPSCLRCSGSFYFLHAKKQALFVLAFCCKYDIILLSH